MRFILVAIIIMAMLTGFTPVLAEGNNIERVSIASDGTQGDNQSYVSSMNDDGRYVAFASWASNLIPNDTNGFADVFVRDHLTHTTTLVSVSDNGTQGDSTSSMPSISGDNRYVTFASFASNLVTNDINGQVDIFVRDRLTHSTTMVSISDNGTLGNNQSLLPSISGDGRYIAFQSSANNLVPNDKNGFDDIFVRDCQTKTTSLVSVSYDGTQGNNTSGAPKISDDGRYIAFDSSATNLVPNDANGVPDVFVRDLLTNTITRFSISSGGTQGNLSSSMTRMSVNSGRCISADGRYIVFTSYASNLVPNDTNGYDDIFIHDRQTHTTAIVSIASGDIQANSASLNASLSRDGCYVSFSSEASNLVPNDNNGQPDVFVHDCQNDTTFIVSISSNSTQGNRYSGYSCMGDGRYIAFASDSSNLVPDDTNGMNDIFVVDNPLYKELPTSASVNTAAGTGIANFVTNNGGFADLTAALIATCGIYPGFEFPHGFFSFTVDNLNPGDAATVTITFPSDIPTCTQYWKCINDEWVDATSNLGDNDGDNVLTLTITDGSQFDADRQTNGTIVDPGGPAIPAAVAEQSQHHVSPATSPLKSAQMSVQYICVNPQHVYANQPVTISTNVVNTANQAGNYYLSSKINGNVEQTKSVSAGPYSAQPVKFTVTKAQPGTYTIDIGGQNASFTVLGATGSGNPTSKDAMMAILVIGTLVLVSVVVILVIRRLA